LRKSWIVACLLPLLVGCATLGQGFRSDPFAAASERSLLVLVENTTQDDVRVEVRGPGDRHSIGVVSARSNRQVAVPWPEYQEIRFQIDPFVARQAIIMGGTAGPGDRVNLVVVTPFERSFVRR
jgi:hypothetical protein